MTEDRVTRLERIVLGDGVDEPGILTRLVTIQGMVTTVQGMLEKHLTETALPTRSVILSLVVGAIVSAGVGASISYLSTSHPVAAHTR